MNLVKRQGQVVYEDLLREMELIEQELRPENSGAAMRLMVLEAKLRDRFHQIDSQKQFGISIDGEELLVRDDMSASDLEALIPRDLPLFPESHALSARHEQKTWETAAVAAGLAVATAFGVFGLATVFQIFLGWIA